MNHVESSSFATAPRLSLVHSRVDESSQNEAFSAAINALSMARHYLLTGDERAAAHKASAALSALLRLAPLAEPMQASQAS